MLLYAEQPTNQACTNDCLPNRADIAPSVPPNQEREDYMSIIHISESQKEKEA